MNVIIVGATSGIGRELFTLYNKEGHAVGVLGRRTALLEELCHAYPLRTYGRSLDITDRKAVDEALESLFAEMGRPDLIIVCAGTGDLNPELDFAKEWPALQTNVLGWTYVVDKAYLVFEQQGYGHLAVITSVGGLRGECAAPAYNASKAYQINYTEALRKKAWKSGLPLFVTDIRPGLTDTAMAKGEGLFWVMPVSKVAAQAYEAIARKAPVRVITRRWRAVAWLMRCLPFAWYKRI